MDIFDGLAKARLAFMAAGMKPPKAILLESHKEGIRFLSAVRQQTMWTATAGSAGLGNPVEMADGSVYMEVEVMGIAVRWPAEKYALKDGTWRFV